MDEEKHESRTCADGRVRVVTIRGKSFMLGQEPKTTVSITVKMRTVPTACAVSQLKHIGTCSRWINEQVPGAPLESWVKAALKERALEKAS